MSITLEQREQIARELKRIATGLDLSEDQKERVKGFLTEAHEKVQVYRQQNPNASTEDMVRKMADQREAIRERLVKFLTPKQLKIWDTEIAKAKDFLGQKLAA